MFVVVFGVERVEVGHVVAAVAVEAEAVAVVEVVVAIVAGQGEAWKLFSPQRSLAVVVAVVVVVVVAVVPPPLAVSPSLPSWPSNSFGHSPNSLRVEPFGASSTLSCCCASVPFRC